MRHETLYFCAAMAAALALASQTTAEAAPPSVHARAQAAADQGPRELYQFVNRTRMIYGLNIQDYQVKSPAPDAEIIADANFAPSGDAQEEQPRRSRQDELDAEREQLWRDMQYE